MSRIPGVNTQFGWLFMVNKAYNMVYKQSIGINFVNSCFPLKTVCLLLKYSWKFNCFPV